jgi:hypothetical protein
LTPHQPTIEAIKALPKKKKKKHTKIELSSPKPPRHSSLSPRTTNSQSSGGGKRRVQISEEKHVREISYYNYSDKRKDSIRKSSEKKQRSISKRGSESSNGKNRQ